MINQINENISQQNDSTSKKILFTDNKLDFETNAFLQVSTIELILSSERFSCLLIE